MFADISIVQMMAGVTGIPEEFIYAEEGPMNGKIDYDEIPYCNNRPKYIYAGYPKENCIIIDQINECEFKDVQMLIELEYDESKNKYLLKEVHIYKKSKILSIKRWCNQAINGIKEINDEINKGIFIWRL